MIWFFGILVVLLIGAVVVVASGRGDPMVPSEVDQPDLQLRPVGPLTGDDLRRVRFSTAVRGYRAGEVDRLLARLAEQLDGREEGPEHGGGFPG